MMRNRQASRQVLAYDLFFSGDSGPKSNPMTVVVKRFSDRAKGEREYRAMRILWENGFNHSSNLRIPEPFLYSEDLGLLVQEKARGISLRRYLGKKGPVAISRMKSAALWLKKLHHLRDVKEAIPLHPDDETSIERFVRQVATREPLLSSRMEELASRIVAVSRNRQRSLTPVHGDFQCENILVGKEGVTVLDFGRFSKSDPARDVGYMIAQVRVMALFDGAAPVSHGLGAFWEEYQSAVPGDERVSFSGRTCLFAAIKSMENVGYIVSFSPSGERREIVDFLLKDAASFCEAKGVEEILERSGSW